MFTTPISLLPLNTTNTTTPMGGGGGGGTGGGVAVPYVMLGQKRACLVYSITLSYSHPPSPLTSSYRTNLPLTSLTFLVSLSSLLPPPLPPPLLPFTPPLYPPLYPLLPLPLYPQPISLPCGRQNDLLDGQQHCHPCLLLHCTERTGSVGNCSSDRSVHPLTHACQYTLSFPSHYFLVHPLIFPLTIF